MDVAVEIVFFWMPNVVVCGCAAGHARSSHASAQVAGGCLEDAADACNTHSVFL